MEGRREGREERRARGRGEEVGRGRKERREEREGEMRRRANMWRTSELSIYSHMPLVRAPQVKLCLPRLLEWWIANLTANSLSFGAFIHPTNDSCEFLELSLCV